MDIEAAYRAQEMIPLHQRLQLGGSRPRLELDQNMVRRVTGRRRRMNAAGAMQCTCLSIDNQGTHNKKDKNGHQMAHGAFLRLATGAPQRNRSAPHPAGHQAKAAFTATRNRQWPKPTPRSVQPSSLTFSHHKEFHVGVRQYLRTSSHKSNSRFTIQPEFVLAQ
jgi:hypothetical protein